MQSPHSPTHRHINTIFFFFFLVEANEALTEDCRFHVCLETFQLKITSHVLLDSAYSAEKNLYVEIFSC